jgi:uncharacterized membrane-anchored protein
MAKGSGKRRGSLSQAARPPRPTPLENQRWEVDQSRSVQSAWIWRGFLMMSLVALGVSIILFGNHRYQTMAILWLVIAAGWFGISMWLWRKHSQYMRS